MTVRGPFNPDRGANAALAPNNGSAGAAIRADAKSYRVVNPSATICFVRTGQGSQTASAADTPVRPTSDVVLAKGDGDDNVAVYSTGNITVYVQTGEGGTN